MKTVQTAILMLGCVVLSIKASLGAESVLLDGVACQVNDHVITIGEVINVMRPVEARLRQNYKGAELKQLLSSNFLDTATMLMEKYLVLDSIDRSTVAVPDWFVDRRANEIIKDVFANDKAELMKVLTNDRQTYEEWREQIREHILVASMRARTVEQKVNLSPVVLREAYDKNRDHYRRPGQTRIRVIALKEKDAERAKEVAGKLAAGSDFAALAKDYSTGANAEKGGDWGLVSPNTLRRELAEEIDRLKSGEFSLQPVVAGEELYFVKVEEKKESVLLPFEEVQAEVERDLRRAESETIYQAWIARLKKNAYIKMANVEHLFE